MNYKFAMVYVRIFDTHAVYDKVDATIIEEVCSAN
ncbi:hypothetical protein L5L55_17995 [Shewanella glacialipiscicola]|nr:hypothetical protein [Shewanella glacialipiscicola]MCU8028068.1 hypothetical protein [Shewanella glacialipiscicola]